jgi:chromatin assembly factor 1 subunit B
MNPTPSLGSVPGIAAAHSGPVPNYMTPPETPAATTGAGRTHSASSSVSGIGNLRPDNESVSGSFATRNAESDVDMSEDAGTRKREAQAESSKGRPEKRRRIEPTLVKGPEEKKE